MPISSKIDRVPGLVIRAAGFVASALTGMALMEMVGLPGRFLEEGLTMKFVGALLVTSACCGTLLWSKRDRSLGLGMLLGLQLGFFELQRAAALASGKLALAQGSERVMAAAGIAAIIAGTISWIWKAFGRRFYS